MDIMYMMIAILIIAAAVLGIVVLYKLRHNELHRALPRNGNS